MGEISDISSRCYRAPILIVDRKRLELSTSSMPWRRATITLPARGPDRTRTDHLCNPPAMPVSVDLARIELATLSCEDSGIPLTYRPAGIDIGGQVRMQRSTR